MLSEELNKFLEGENKLEDLRNKAEDNSMEKQFAENYQEVIRQTQSDIPEFNPFEKIELLREKRNSIGKKLLTYAASLLFVASMIFVFTTKRQNKSTLHLSEQEILEIKKNTTMALTYFSRELNNCMSEFEEASIFQQAANEFKTLSEINIQKDNPFKNIKIN